MSARFGRRAAAIPAAGLAFALTTGSCSIVLVQGPPRPAESDYDPTGRYEGGVPCTSSRMWPLVDLGLMLWTLAATANYDNRDDREDGAMTTAALAVSALIGYWRTNDCRAAEAAAGSPPASAPPFG